jgi:hypothetical protein
MNIQSNGCPICEELDRQSSEALAEIEGALKDGMENMVDVSDPLDAAAKRDEAMRRSKAAIQRLSAILESLTIHSLEHFEPEGRPAN